MEPGNLPKAALEAPGVGLCVLGLFFCWVVVSKIFIVGPTVLTATEILLTGTRQDRGGCSATTCHIYMSRQWSQLELVVNLTSGYRKNKFCQDSGLKCDLRHPNLSHLNIKLVIFVMAPKKRKPPKTFGCEARPLFCVRITLA